jgi:hypothetical protein
MLFLLLACSQLQSPPPAPIEVIPAAPAPAPEVAPAPAEAAPAAPPVEPPAAAADPAVKTDPGPKTELKADPKATVDAAVKTEPKIEDPAVAAAAAAEQLAIQAKLDAAKKAVDDIYAPYLANGDPPEVKRYFSRGLRAQFDAVEKYEEANDTLIFDFDPVINAQDWELAGLSTVATMSGEKVQVVASFKNGGKSEKITYILVQEGESWKVDNMRAAKWDLRKLLKVPKG